MVDPESDGLRVDRFLSTRIRRLSRARAARLEVFDLDAPDQPLKKSASVRAGQRLWARRPVPDADATLVAPSVIYEDEAVLVLDKPAGLAVHPTASRYRTTVTHWLASRPNSAGVEPAHRLDVETSGVLLCGKGHSTVRALRLAFAEGKPSKAYLAVVEGLPTTDAWTMDTALGFATDSAVRIKMGHGDKPARTDFRVRARGRGRALVEAHPVTGRQHQVRVHCAMAGHPIVGDKLYGPDEALFLAHLERALTGAEMARLGHHRQALHAWRLEVSLAGRDLAFEAACPASFSALYGDD